MNDTFIVFGYGSLIFSPELPESVIRRIPARLPGYRRSFNKRSTLRGCALGECYNAFPEVNDGFLTGNFLQSLVLGTEPDRGTEIVGVGLEYAAEVWDELFRLNDVREYFDPDRAGDENGYLRTTVQIMPLEGGSWLESVTYLSNVSETCIWRAPSSLSLEQHAKVLINATPKGLTSGESITESEHRARGLYYLEGVRRKLRSIGITDVDLERLATAVLAIDGPWQVLVQATDSLG